MKKVFVLALMLVMVMSAGVLAEEPDREVTINLKVLPHVQVVAPDELNFEVAGNGDSDTQNAAVTISSNTSFNLTVESTGFGENFGLLNQAVTYSAFGRTLNPTEKITQFVPFLNQPVTIGVTLDYAPGENWSDIPAADYQDTITLTVEAAD